MNSKIYRCGWCGHPTDKDGKCLTDKAFKKAINIIEKYGDHHTTKVNGECCPTGGISEIEREQQEYEAMHGTWKS